MLVAHRFDVAGVHLGVAAEEAMPVQRCPPRVRGRDGARQRRARDVARERRLLRRRLVQGEPVGAEDVPRPRARRAHVALDEERPGDAAEDLVVHARAAAVVDLRHDECRRRRAEPGEAVVAHEEQPLGDVPPARHREVPGEVEVAPADARRRERREQVLHVRPACLDRGIGRECAVPVGDERRIG